MRKICLLISICIFSAIAAIAQTEGSLYAVNRKGVDLGACPLKHTSVKTEISGFLARVTIVQEFENNFAEPIEAVYTFPLSDKSAVDAMTMRVGERTIRGKILKREEARRVYETAKNEGKTASLLDQQRPNIFTQSVANILPNEKISVEISYVETLKYEDGAYEFVFPMTVAPRYIPASVKDASKISPPVAKTRAGHDISIEVNLNAGVPVEEIRSTSHEIETVNSSANSANIKLKNQNTIPNKDFILRYDVSGKRIEDAILTHTDERGGFFTMILQPPDKLAAEDRTPKEIVFVLDTSGSMNGFPIEKAKEAMKLSLENLYPDDTFNLITFAGDTDILFDEPVPATQANLERAKAFLESRSGAGGTEMMTAIKGALEPSDAADHVRIVCFMTDGVVGNDGEIISEVQKHPNARVFSFGIGQSVNRSLLNKIAEEGRGEAEFVALEDDGSRAAKRFYERVRTPILTDISIDWNGLPVADVYPNRISDLFSAKPVIIHGRYTKGASGTIKLKGKVAGQDFVREIAVNLPDAESRNDVLATLWARTRIDDLTKQDYEGVQNGNAKPDVQNTITNIGLEYRLLTQFTSFVAVEEKIVNQNGKPTTVEVPVELPEGMTAAEQDSPFRRLEILAGLQRPPQVTYGRRNTRPTIGNGNANVTGVALSSNGMGTGGGTGSGNGNGSGSVSAQVNVTAGAAAVDLSSSQLSTTVTTQQIQSLPINGRNLSSFYLSGNRQNSNVFQIDGAENEEIIRITTNDADVSKSVSGDLITGAALDLPKPVVPANAHWNGQNGLVNVQIKINETGDVVSAQAVSGHPLLKAAAEMAARKAKFAPVSIAGIGVEIVGEIVYKFAAQPDKTEISIGKMSVAPLAPENRRRISAATKLHFWIFALVERLQKANGAPAANEAKFVKNGKADVQIELTRKTPETIAKLKATGFEIIDDKNAKTVTGRIAIEKLADLTTISEVRYVLPKIR